MINGKRVIIRKTIGDPVDLPDLTPKEGMFIFVPNPEHNPVSINTIKTYRVQLNRVAKELKIDTPAKLVNEYTTVIRWLHATLPELQKRKLFLSAVFYQLTQKPWTDTDRLPYYMEFNKAKLESVGATAKKENYGKILGQMADSMKKMADNIKK